MKKNKSGVVGSVPVLRNVDYSYKDVLVRGTGHDTRSSNIVRVESAEEAS